MPSISVTEQDFTTLACAAMSARDAGEMEQARALDKLARKANAALTGSGTGVQIARRLGANSNPIRWQDMPSTIGE